MVGMADLGVPWGAGLGELVFKSPVRFAQWPCAGV